MTEKYHFQLKHLNTIRDTPERLGFKEHDQFLAVDIDGNLKVMSVYSGTDNLNKPILKFPNTLHKIVSNVSVK